MDILAEAVDEKNVDEQLGNSLILEEVKRRIVARYVESFNP